jgi:hypothetical protein
VDQVSVKTREELEGAPGQAANSVLLPLPEPPPVTPISQGDPSFDVFSGLRRIGLTYLDENGEPLEFSAGAESSHQTWRNDETENQVESECSDSESDAADPQPKRFVQDVERRDYWPYPSKTVSIGIHT